MILQKLEILEQDNNIRFQATTGPRVTTPRVPSLSIKFLMSFAVKLRAATASKASRSPTLLVVVPVPVWERC